MEIKAFLAEDNLILRENLTGTLEELTCVIVVGACATQEESLAWLSSHDAEWDLLVVDLFLNPGSGIRIVEQVRRSRPEQKVVVLSNYINADVRKQCARLGVDAVFDKSTEIDALVDYCARQCFEQAGEPPGMAFFHEQQGGRRPT